MYKVGRARVNLFIKRDNGRACDHSNQNFHRPHQPNYLSVSDTKCSHFQRCISLSTCRTGYLCCCNFLTAVVRSLHIKNSKCKSYLFTHSFPILERYKYTKNTIWCCVFNDWKSNCIWLQISSITQSTDRPKSKNLCYF